MLTDDSYRQIVIEHLPVDITAGVKMRKLDQRHSPEISLEFHSHLERQPRPADTTRT